MNRMISTKQKTIAPSAIVITAIIGPFGSSSIRQQWLAPRLGLGSSRLGLGSSRLGLGSSRLGPIEKPTFFVMVIPYRYDILPSV